MGKKQNTSNYSQKEVVRGTASSCSIQFGSSIKRAAKSTSIYFHIQLSSPHPYLKQCDGHLWGRYLSRGLQEQDMKTENMKKWRKNRVRFWNGAIFIACGFQVEKRLPGALVDIQRCTRPKDINLAVIISGHPELLLLLSDLLVKVKTHQGLMEWVCNYHFPCFILQDSSLGEKVTVGDFRCIVTKQFSRKSIWSALWLFNSWELFPGKKELGIWHLMMALLLTLASASSFFCFGLWWGSWELLSQRYTFHSFPISCSQSFGQPNSFTLFKFRDTL